MPAATMAWAAPTALGLLGMYQNGQAQRKASGMMAKGNAINEEAAGIQLQNAHALQDWAKNYDPATEDARAIDAAKPIVKGTIEEALRNTTRAFMDGGGAPGLSSEFNVRATGATNRATDPFRVWMANQIGTQADRKGAALSRAAGAAPPGGLGDSFYKAYQLSPPPNGAGPTQALIQGLMAMMQQHQGKGAGGSGDSGTYPNNSPFPNPPAGTHYVMDADGNWVAVRDL